MKAQHFFSTGETLLRLESVIIQNILKFFWILGNRGKSPRITVIFRRRRELVFQRQTTAETEQGDLQNLLFSKQEFSSQSSGWKTEHKSDQSD